MCKGFDMELIFAFTRLHLFATVYQEKFKKLMMNGDMWVKITIQMAQNIMKYDYVHCVVPSFTVI